MKSIIYGETAVVIDPDWHGVVKIRVKTGPHTGEVKSYGPEHLTKAERDNDWLRRENGGTEVTDEVRC